MPPPTDEPMDSLRSHHSGKDQTDEPHDHDTPELRFALQRQNDSGKRSKKPSHHLIRHTPWFLTNQIHQDQALTRGVRVFRTWSGLWVFRCSIPSAIPSIPSSHQSRQPKKSRHHTKMHEVTERDWTSKRGRSQGKGVFPCVFFPFLSFDGWPKERMTERQREGRTDG